jgi:hypothetical protein
MTLNRIRTLSTALLLVVLIACAGGLPAEFPAPDFTLKSPLTGTEVSFASLKGKPVIIYWFTSW